MDDWRGMAAAAMAALLLGACGGDGSTVVAGIGSGGTGGVTGGTDSVASGPITGFGSVIVGGVRYDDTAAQVTIDGVAGRPVSDLRIGLVVEVRGTIDAGGATGKAARITAGYAVRGPVADVQPASGTLTVLGQRVRVDPATVLDGVTALAALVPGDVVAVSGLPDPAGGALVATRLERREAAAAPVQSQGTVEGLTATTFRIESLLVDYANAQLTGFANGVALANGTTVAATGTVDAGGVLRASAVRAIDTRPPPGVFLEYVGYVSMLSSPSSFRVGSFVVNAANAKFVGGSPGTLANGLRVEVEGRLVDNVLVAEEVDFLSTGQETALEVEGAITDFLSRASFKVRGQQVDATTATFTGGVAADLGNGRLVHVIGMVHGSVATASSVAFLDAAPVAPARASLDGLVTDFSSPASFRVNGRTISIGAGTAFFGGGAGDIANGRHVAVEGVVVGTTLMADVLRIYPPDPVPLVTTSGRIESCTSPASFVVAGQGVSAGAQTVYVGGTAASIANGVSVVVTGTLSGGVLQATRIEIRAAATESSSPAEVEGYITSFVSAADFKVNGQRVDASAARYEHGTAATLGNGLKVHATGRIMAGVLKAYLLQIDN